MIYHVNRKYKKALIVDSELICAVIREIERICSEFLFEAKLENGDEIEFINKEELFSYKNFKTERILSLQIHSHSKDFQHEVIVVFNPAYFFGFSEQTVDYSIKTTNPDEKKLIEKNLYDEFEFRKQKGGIGLLFNRTSYGIVMFVLWLSLIIISKLFVDTHPIFSLVCVICFGVILFALIAFQKRLFSAMDLWSPRVAFCIGEGKTRYEEYKAKRNNLFWTVCVGGLISIIVSIFCAILF